MTYVHDGFWIQCMGIFDPESATIKGEWTITPSSSRLKLTPGKESLVEPGGHFIFSRTPTTAACFKYLDEAFQKNPAKARWSFACKAVLNGVL